MSSDNQEHSTVQAPAMSRQNELQLASRLLQEVHGGHADDATSALHRLPVREALEVSLLMKQINSLARKERAWFDANVPDIAIDFSRTKDGKLTPGKVRIANPDDQKALPSLVIEAVSPAFLKGIQEGLESLPVSVKEKLAEKNVKIVASRSVVETLPELKNQHPRGYSEGSTFEDCPALNTGELIVVAENTRNGVTEDPQNGIRHESGHGLDGAMSLSNTDDFINAYNRDVSKMSEWDKQYLSYMLQSGEAGRSEAFAEVFATIYGGSTDVAFKQAMERSFPETITAVRKLVEKLEAERTQKNTP